MRTLLFGLLVLGFSSCYQKTVYELPAEYLPKRDTLIVKDTVVMIIKDTVRHAVISIPTNPQKLITPVEKPKPIPVEPQDPYKNPVIHEKYRDPVLKTPSVAVAKSDTVYHYYKGSKAISVKITPWVDGESTTILYNPFGKETYRMEAVRHSYSISVDLKFHPNGSVSEAHINTNPGASMYWYETYITFSINNEPEWKRSEQHPMQSLNDYGKQEYWDKKAGQWKAQEVMEGDPIK